MESANNRRQTLFHLLIGSGLILIAATALWALPKVKGKETIRQAAAPIVVHFPLPDVPLTDLQGHPVALIDYKRQVILYNAWATWCPPCKEEMPVLEAYYQAHKQEGFVVIAIEDGEPTADVDAYAKKMGLTFPVWPDAKSAASEAFLVNSLPTSYVIDRNGFARLMWLGAITREMLEQYVTPLLKE